MSERDRDRGLLMSERDRDRGSLMCLQADRHACKQTDQTDRQTRDRQEGR